MQRGTFESFTETSEIEQQRSVGSFTETQELLRGTSPNNSGGGRQRLCRMHETENRTSGHPPSELEGRRSELTGHPFLEGVNLSLGIGQTANDSSYGHQMQFGCLPRNINLNAVYVDNNGSADHVHDSNVFPHSYKPGGSEINDNSTGGDPGNPSGIAFGSVGHVTVEGDGRPGCSSDGRILRCKRKADGIDVSGQFPQDGSVRENSPVDMVPARSVACSSNVSFVTENSVALDQQLHLNSQYEVGGGGVALPIQPVVGPAGFPEDTQRSSHPRIDHGHRQEPEQLRLNGIGRNGSSAISYTDYLRLAQHHSRNGLDAIHIPGVQRTGGPLLREASANLRSGNMASVMAGGRRSVLPYPTNMPRTTQNPPMRTPVVHTTAVAQPSNLVVPNASTRLPVRPDSISELGSSSRARIPGIPRRAPDFITTIQHSRRLRRTLPLATDFELEDETTGPVLSPNRQGNPPPSQEPVFRSDIQDDDGPEAQLLSRALHAGRENRRRLLSEIHRVMTRFRNGGYPNHQDLALPHALVSRLLDMHDGHRGMRLDVDNMSYEELLALEDQIGNVATGLSEEFILKYLHRVRYLCPRSEHWEVEPCCICQEEISQEEEIGMLDCGHDFHTGCIKRWLMEKNVCPICKTTALVELPDV